MYSKLKANKMRLIKWESRLEDVKLILTGFVVVQENINPSVLMHRPRKLGLYFKDLGLYIFL